MRNILIALYLSLLAGSVSALAQETPVPEKQVLTVYTYDSFASEWGPGPKVELAFELECECDLNFVAVDSSTGILSRIQLEGEGSPADVVLGLDNSLVIEAQNTGLITEHLVDMTTLDLPIDWENQKEFIFDYQIVGLPQYVLHHFVIVYTKS